MAQIILYIYILFIISLGECEWKEIRCQFFVTKITSKKTNYDRLHLRNYKEMLK